MVENLPVRLISCKSVAKDTYEVTFEYDQNLFSFSAGQYVRITIPKLTFADPKGASRDFSIASSPNAKGSFSIAFRYTGSGFKKTLLEAEKGFMVEITGPQAICSLQKMEGETVVFIAGGIGITPFLSMIRFVTEQKLSQKIILLYGNSDKESAAYLDELKKLEEENPNFRMVVLFSHITKDSISQNVADLESKRFCLAGPPEMTAMVMKELNEMGIKKDEVGIEEFSGYAKTPPVSDDASKTKIEPRSDALLAALEKIAIVSATDIKGNITYANDKFIDISKYSKDELMGQNHRIIKSGYHAEAFYKNLWDTISAGKIWHGEIKNKKKDNTFYWVDSSISPTFDEKGKIIGYVAVRFPITETKILEEELLKQLSEIEKKNAFLEDTKRAVLNILEDSREIENDLQKFRLAAENAYEHIIITDESGTIIYANNAVARTTGYTKEEVLGKTPALWSGNMPKSYYDKMWDTIKRKKIAFEGEIKNKRKNGEEYTAQISISPILDENKNIKFYVGLERDITKERNLTEELRKEKEGVEKKVELQTKEIKEEKNRLFTILESMPVGIFVLDSQGNPFYVNSEGKRLLGKGVINSETNELAINYNVYKAGTNILYPNEELPVVQALHGKAVTVQDIEIKNGEKTVAVEVSSAPIFNSEGKIVFAIAAFKDITEEKMLDRSKDEFFSIASHELRTPLTAIRGNTALIKQYFKDALSNNKDLEEMIDDIHESSLRLIEIVNDFLNLSRLEQGKMEFKPENIDILELIDKAKEEISNLAKQKNLTITLKKDEQNIYMVYADKVKLLEVTLNLLGNAIKYTEKGGVIISVSANHDFVKVSFADTGRGISGEQQSLLFRKFQQAGESILTRDTTKGTGLGLYISRLMIESMGGRIELESSSLENGSVFSFTVPVAK